MRERAWASGRFSSKATGSSWYRRMFRRAMPGRSSSRSPAPQLLGRPRKGAGAADFVVASCDVTALQHGDGLDTALARLLLDQGTVEYSSLRLCLNEVRQRRATDRGVTLATLLVQRQLATANFVSDALAKLVEDPTLLANTLPEAAPDTVGSSLPRKFGPYALVREIARGGMGAVHEVIDEQTGTHYALKTLLPSLPSAATSEEFERFRREAEVMGKLNHPNVARIHAAVLAGPNPYLVQDLLTGGTLHERIRSGSMDIGEAVEIAAKLARGLQHSHDAGVLHRDLKPKNVLFNDQGEPQLVDFGLAYVSEVSQRLTETGTVMGTPGYMAPEQAEGYGDVDARTDVYGLGAVLYAMLTGGPPFEGAGVYAVLHKVVNQPPVPPSQVRSEIPTSVDAVCLKALAKAREERYQDANALILDLDACLAGEQRTAHWALTPKALAVAGLLLVAVGLGVSAMLAPRPAPATTNPGRAEGPRLPAIDARNPDTEYRALRDLSPPQEQIAAGRAWLTRYGTDHALSAKVEAFVNRLEADHPLRVLEHPQLVYAGFLTSATAWTLGADGRLATWDLETGKQTEDYQMPRLGSGPLVRPAVLRDGALAVAERRGPLTWFSRGKFVPDLVARRVFMLCASPDGRWLAANIRDRLAGKLIVLDTKTRSEVCSLPIPKELVGCLRFSPDSTRLVVFTGRLDWREAQDYNRMSVFSIPSGKRLADGEVRDLVRGAAFLAGGELVVGNMAGGVQEWSLSSATFVRTVLDPNWGRPPDSALLGGTHELRATRSGFLISRHSEHGPTRNRAHVMVWDLQAETIRGNSRTPGLDPIDLELSPDERSFLVAGGSGTAELWRAPR